MGRGLKTQQSSEASRKLLHHHLDDPAVGYHKHPETVMLVPGSNLRLGHSRPIHPSKSMICQQEAARTSLRTVLQVRDQECAESRGQFQPCCNGNLLHSAINSRRGFGVLSAKDVWNDFQEDVLIRCVEQVERAFSHEPGCLQGLLRDMALSSSFVRAVNGCLNLH